MAGLLSKTCVFPFDVIRKRLQVGDTAPGDYASRGSATHVVLFGQNVQLTESTIFHAR